MKITIGSEHLQSAKQQAHNIRTNLIQTPFLNELETIHSKSSFMNTWADCLGHKDWGEFQAITRHANQMSSNSIIISPETIDILAERLCEKSYSHAGNLHSFLNAIYRAASKEEKALFSTDDDKELSIQIGSESAPIELELGPDKYSSQLIDMLFSHYFSHFEKTDLIKSLLDTCKDKRKQLKNGTKEKFKAAGLDIYPKSGKRPEDVIEKACTDNWIVASIDYQQREPRTIYKLSDRSINWLFLTLTDDESSEWLAWNKEVDKLLKESKNPRRLELQFGRIRAFSDRLAPEQYTQNNEVAIDIHSPCPYSNGEYLNKLMEEVKFDIPDFRTDMEIFHFVPELLMSYSEYAKYESETYVLNADLIFLNEDNSQTSSVSYGPEFFDLLRPHRNRRYIVGVKNKKQGVYVHVPANSHKIEVSLNWKDTSTRTVLNHKITYTLVRTMGNIIFSSDHIDVSIRGNSNAVYSPTSIFNIATSIGCAKTKEEVITLPRFENQIRHFHSDNNQVNIIEEIVLSSCAVENYTPHY